MLRSPIMKGMLTNYTDSILKSVIDDVPLLHDLQEGELRRLATNMTVLTLETGNAIFNNNDTAELFYIIISGEVKIIDYTTLKERVLGRGEYFGEVSLVTVATRSTTAIVQSRAVLLSINGKNIYYICVIYAIYIYIYNKNL